VDAQEADPVEIEEIEVCDAVLRLDRRKMGRRGCQEALSVACLPSAANGRIAFDPVRQTTDQLRFLVELRLKQLMHAGQTLGECPAEVRAGLPIKGKAAADKQDQQGETKDRKDPRAEPSRGESRPFHELALKE
jgi:hypothetical protein